MDTCIISHVLSLLVILTLVDSSNTLWWWFTTEEETGVTPVTDTSLVKIFAPFEITPTEEKFLNDASHYLSNLPKLDQCNLLIVNRIKKSCSKMSEVDLSKLGVNLLNCQSAVEGRKIYPCTDSMTLGECTKDMDSDAWNSYHIVSNRARAICYNVRQAEFRMKTEMTVNRLSQSAKENLVNLEQILEGQGRLKDAAAQTMNQLLNSQNEVIDSQKRLRKEQSELQAAIADSITRAGVEKQLIKSRQKDVEKLGRTINVHISSLTKELKKQNIAQKNSDDEIKKHLKDVQDRTFNVLARLENTLETVDKHYESIEERHTETMKNVEKIEKAVNFMTKILNKMESTFNNRIEWINHALGGTEDKVTAMTILISHVLHFFIGMLSMAFIGASWVSKASVMILVPLNCIMALQGSKHLNYSQLGMLMALTYPVSWISRLAIRYSHQFGNGWNKLSSLRFYRDQSPLKLTAVQDESTVASSFDKSESAFSSSLLYVGALNESKVDYSVNSSPTSTPNRAKRRLDISTSYLTMGTPSRSMGRRGSTSESPRKCLAKTKTGTLCHNRCVPGERRCHLHGD